MYDPIDKSCQLCDNYAIDNGEYLAELCPDCKARVIIEREGIKKRGEWDGYCRRSRRKI